MAKITKEQIEKWKKENPKGVYKISTEDGKSAYLKTPNRNTLSFATSFLPGDRLGYADAILANCWLGGDEKLKTEDKYFLGIASQIDDIVEVVEAKLEKC